MTLPKQPAPTWSPGDREAVARIIDPSSWAVFDGYLADVKRHYKGQDAGFDPDAFKDKKSLAKADAILAILSAPPLQSRAPGIGGGEYYSSVATSPPEIASCGITPADREPSGGGK